ncbi:MAG: DUF3261 domain-containing protein [Kangiellaceae bacterium]|nr:DUF3261 domain-containing protein [Kangiellaceae bacterium]
MQSKLTFITCLLLFIASCSTRQVQQHSTIDLANGVSFELQSPSSFGKNFITTQLATIEYQEQKHELLFQLEIDQQRIILVGLTPSGTRLFTIISDGNTVQADGFKAVVEQIKPEYLLADMQIALWPQQIIQAAVQAESVSIKHNTDSRILMVSKKPLIEINYSDILVYKHLERGYQISIQTLSSEESAHIDGDFDKHE